MPPRADLLPGTLDLLILKAVSLGSLSGYAIMERIEQMTGGALLVFGATTLHVALWRPERFELNEIIIRAVSLTVMAALLVEFGSYGGRVRRDLQRIVTGPEVSGADLAELARQLSQWIGSVMGGRRTLIAWTQRDEPVLWLAAWEGGEARLTREVSGVLEPLVVHALKDTNFLCRRARRPRRQSR